MKGLVEQILNVVENTIGIVINPDSMDMMEDMIADQIRDWTDDDNINWDVNPKWVEDMNTSLVPKNLG